MEVMRMKKETKVVAGFPGTGKSYMFRNNTDNLVLLDSDSSIFSWISKGVRNPIFPQNYMEHIKENLGVADVIFVSTHDTVIKALQENGIPFTLVYPTKELKEIYLSNYAQRGNDAQFIEFIKNNWDNFITNMMKTECQQRIELKKGQYIKDIIEQIIQ